MMKVYNDNLENKVKKYAPTVPFQLGVIKGRPPVSISKTMAYHFLSERNLKLIHLIWIFSRAK